MKKFLIPLLGLFVLTSTLVSATEEEKEVGAEAVKTEGAVPTTEEAKTAPSEETKTAPSEEAKTVPSEETKKVAHKAKEETSTFDPQTYTCKQFVEDFNKEEATDELGIAAIWGHGYFSSAYGTDEMGPLNEESVAEVIQYFLEYCEKNKSETLSRAAYKIAEDEGEE